MNAAVAGAGVVLPGAGSPDGLCTKPGRSAQPVDPGALIGRRGLRYKDRATQLGLCAAAAALRDAGLLTDGAPVPAGEATGVVVSSNLGNVDTICRTQDVIADETVLGTSPMDLPNASSNVIASSVAIRFGLRGPNLTVCNGPTSGVDAVYWASVLIAAGRAERMLVLGVEPDNAPVRALVGAPTLDGAVGLVLEGRTAAAGRRGAAVRGVVAGYARAPELSACLDQLRRTVPGVPAMWQLPETADGPPPAEVLTGVPRDDLGQRWGRASGALGVLQCAAVVGWFDRGGAGPVYAVAGERGAVAGLALVRAEDDDR